MEYGTLVRKQQRGLNGADTRSLALAALLLTVFALRAQNVIDIPKFYRVSDHIYRGAQPSEEGLRELSKLGVVTVLDLRPGEEKDSDEGHQAFKLGLHYINVPMNGFRGPTQEQIERGLRVLQTPANWPVFVHCHYGVDRTGTLIACYRIQVQSWPNQRAKKEAEELGMHSFERGMKSFILHFQSEPLPPPSSEMQSSQPAR